MKATVTDSRKAARAAKSTKHHGMPGMMPQALQHTEHQQSIRLRRPIKKARPMNSFLLFHNDMVEERKISLNGDNNPLVSKELGCMWEKLSPENKLPYQLKAYVVRLQHKYAHPNYSYTTTKSTKATKATKAAKMRRSRPATSNPNTPVLHNNNATQQYTVEQPENQHSVQAIPMARGYVFSN